MTRRHRIGVPFIRRGQPPGSEPGAVAIGPRAEPHSIKAFVYGPSGCSEHEPTTPDEAAALRGTAPVAWINVDGLDRPEVLHRLGELFGLHPLALEDVANVHQRAKVEPYPGHLFIVARMVHADGNLCSEQISMFVGTDFLLSFQERAGDSFDQVRKRLCGGVGRIRGGGAAYLAYALLDALIDAYFPVVEAYGERLAVLDEESTERPDMDRVGAIHAIRRDLLLLRRAVWPHREAVAVLLREETPLVDDSTRVYLRDCYDHTIQLVDLIDTYRDLATGLLDVHMSMVSHRINEVMKVLTIFAAIFIPLTFIAGVYGMNLGIVPGPGDRWGFAAVLAVMVAVAVVMLGYFRHLGWIGGSRGR